MDMQAVGERIRVAREAKHLTQQSLAEEVGLSAPHISVIERGVKAPRLDTFVAIANALDVSADELLIDVVDHATQGVATELSSAIAEQPWEYQKRILNAVKALVAE